MSLSHRAWTAALLYLLFGIGWILFSDQILAALSADIESFARVSRYKGLVFVALTALLIFVLLRRPASVAAVSESRLTWAGGSLLALFLILTLFVVAMAYRQIDRAREGTQADALADLRAVSRLKQRDVIVWLDAVHRASASLRDNVSLDDWRTAEGAQRSALRERTDYRLRAFCRTFGFDAIWLVDARGRIDLGTAAAPANAAKDWAALLARSNTHSVVHSGLRLHDGRWVMDVAVALRDVAGRPLAYAIARRRTDDLFTSLAQWPLPSNTAELVLVRREANRVWLLPISAAATGKTNLLSRPMSEPDLLSAKLLRNEIPLDAAVEGHDYRGVRSLGVGQQIPGTDWYLLAKMDRSELYAGAERDVNQLIGSYLLVLLLVGSAGIYVYQRRNLSHVNQLRDLQEKQLDTLQLIDTIATASDDIIFAKDIDGRYVLVNRAFLRAMGFTQDQVIGRTDAELFPDEHARRFVEDDQAIIASGTSRTYEEVVGMPDGEHVFLTTKGPLRHADGAIKGVYAITRDVTALKHNDAALAQAAMVIHSMQDGVMVTDAGGHILSVNQAFTDITGYAEDEVVGRTPALLHSGRQSKEDYAAMWQAIGSTGAWQGEIWNRRKNGEIYPEWLSISAMLDGDGRPTRYVGVFTDISRLKRSEADLAKLAHYDPLTGLPNRRLINERLASSIQRSNRHGNLLAVLYLDLDHFKTVNDSLGHQFGDELLIGVTERLRQRLRNDDMIGRLGGDEFLILLDTLNQPEDAGMVAYQLLDSLAQPFLLGERHEAVATGSIGISIYPGNGDDAGELMRNADAAMYRAKERGRNQFCFYTAEMNTEAQTRMQLDAALRHALERDELRLYYQPKVDVHTGRIAGAEALLRWQRNDGDMVSPAAFIPLAEQIGLILPIGNWVIDRACADLRAWRDQGIRTVPIAVNVSARQFMAGDVRDIVTAALMRHDIDNTSLELELTESALVDHPERATVILDELKQAGYALALDDFGTGYSSLSYLMRFPMDVLKIDQSFVRGIGRSAEAETLAGAIIMLAHRMGMKVVAEGVETLEQFEFLRDQGCELVQGYYFSRPVAAEAFAELLRRELRMPA